MWKNLLTALFVIGALAGAARAQTNLDGTACVGTMVSDNGGKGAAAFVFERHGGGVNAWDQVATLTAADAVANDLFGSAVAISGDTALVGAYQDDDAGASSGSAYIFERHQGGAWGQARKLTAGDAATDDSFGVGVAIDGDVAVVGAYGDDGAGLNAGAAYVFERHEGDAGAWGQVAKLTAADAATGDRLGLSVAIGGGTALVGVPQRDDAGNNAGAAHVFERSQNGANVWSEVGKLTGGAAAAGDLFGHSVGISDGTALVGAYGAGGLSGAVYFFDVAGDDTPPQLALPNEVVAEATSSDGAVVTYDAAADDVDGDGPVTPDCEPPSGTAFPLGTTTVTCTATDSAGNTSSGEFPVRVQDTTDPVITCNAPQTITPPMAPVWFTATGDDVVSTPTTIVTSYSCTAVNGSGRLIDRSESCIVAANGATVQIVDAGGVGDHISWTVTSTDEAGNESTAACAVDVVNPGRGGR